MIAKMGIPTVSSQAAQFLSWTRQYVAGILTSGPKGYNPLAADTYHVQLDGTGCSPQVRGTPHATWADHYNFNILSGWIVNNSNSCVPAAPDTYPGIIVDFIPGSRCSGGYCGAFVTNKAGSLAELLTNEWEPQGIEAYAFNVSQTKYAYCCAPTYGGFTDQAHDIRDYPEFNTIPKLPNGNFLRQDEWYIDASFDITGSHTTTVTPTVTANAPDCLVVAVANNAPGGSSVATLNGCSGYGILMGHKGTATLNAGTGPQWMFGHWEAATTTFNDNVGNNYMKGGGTLNNFKFNTVGGGTTEIANFNPATDTLTVKTNLNGNGITTAAGVYGTCSVAGGKTTCNLGTGNKVVTLDGLTSNIGPSGSNRIVMD